MSRVGKGIDERRLKRLFMKMLEIYSPSGKEEDLVDYLYGYLKRHGLPVVRQEVDDNRHNLWVCPTGDEARLALVGHVDTVPAYELEEFGPSEESGRVRGLGAADMKGGCAAMVEAMVSLWEQGQNDLPVALALVVGEEVDGDGAARLAKEYVFPWAVIGEPTNLAPCLSHYGYLELVLNTKGKRRHAAMAGQGCHAVEEMLKVLLHLTDYLGTRRPSVVYNLRDIYSSGGGFVVPDGCEAWVDLHLPPDSPIAEITMEIEELAAAAPGEVIECRLSLFFETLAAGYELPEKGPVAAALREAFDKEALPWLPRSFPSHSDANQFWAAGVKPILFGPGHLEEAHRPEESVDFAQVAAAARVYRRLAKSAAAPDIGLPQPGPILAAE